MTQTPEMREVYARIIDPEAWDEISADDNEEGAAIFAEAWDEALAKADKILGLAPLEGGGEGMGSSVAESGGTALPKSEGPGFAGWNPISTAPRDGTHIILAFGQDGVMEGWWDDNDPGPYPWKFLDRGAPGSTGYAAGGFINGSREVRGGPTHWQPLPSPPAESRAGQPSEASTAALATDEPPSSSPPQATNSEVERLREAMARVSEIVLPPHGPFENDVALILAALAQHGEKT